jgi:hypothetical protein
MHFATPLVRGIALPRLGKVTVVVVRRARLLGAERLHYTPPDPLCHSLIHLPDDAQEAGIWNPGAKYEKFLSGCCFPPCGTDMVDIG